MGGGNLNYYAYEQRTAYPNELMHHGIKGQQWGVKHGPPYPLDKKTSRSIKRAAGVAIGGAVTGAALGYITGGGPIGAGIGALAGGAALPAVAYSAANKRETQEYIKQENLKIAERNTPSGWTFDRSGFYMKKMKNGTEVMSYYDADPAKLDDIYKKIESNYTDITKKTSKEAYKGASEWGVGDSKFSLKSIDVNTGDYSNFIICSYGAPSIYGRFDVEYDLKTKKALRYSFND